jgi:TRAP-type C4-dicarboxylate transport system permease large subunit
VTSFGVDPVHFGMIMLVNLGIGLITPPVGAVLMAVTYIPAISLWLPSVVL